MITEIHATNFKDTVNQIDDNLKIVFIYGAGCGPCAATKPKYDMVANYFSKLGANINFYASNAWGADNREFFKTEVPVAMVPTFHGYFRKQLIWKTEGGLDTAPMKDAILSIMDNVYVNYKVKI